MNMTELTKQTLISTLEHLLDCLKSGRYSESLDSKGNLSLLLLRGAAGISCCISARSYSEPSGSLYTVSWVPTLIEQPLTSGEPSASALPTPAHSGRSAPVSSMSRNSHEAASCPYCGSSIRAVRLEFWRNGRLVPSIRAVRLEFWRNGRLVQCSHDWHFVSRGPHV
jgi:hypothetical protein